MRNWRLAALSTVLCAAVWLGPGASAGWAAALGQREVWPNGLVLLFAEQHDVPIVTVSMIVGAGAVWDPSGKPGVANLVADTMTQGTTTRSAPQISEAIDFLGGSLSVDAGQEATTLSLAVRSKDLDAGLDLLADVLLHPVFSPNEIQRQVQEVVAGIRRSQEDPGTVAWQAFMALVYGAHPFGRPVEGTESSVRTITRDDLVRFHADHFRPNNTIVAVVGDVRPADLRQKLTARLGAWQKGELSTTPPAQPPRLDKRVTKTIQRDVTQANIVLGHLGVTRNNPDYYALQVMNYLLGGGFSSYLVSAIREEKGWAYDVGSAFGPGKISGEFSITMQTKNDVAKQAIDAALAQVRRMRDQPVRERDLADAKAFLTGSFPLRLDTSSKLAAMLASIEFYGLGLDYVDRYPSLINAVTVADVQRVAKKYLDPDKFALAVVADLSKAKIEP